MKFSSLIPKESGARYGHGHQHHEHHGGVVQGQARAFGGQVLLALCVCCSRSLMILDGEHGEFERGVDLHRSDFNRKESPTLPD